MTTENQTIMLHEAVTAAVERDQGCDRQAVVDMIMSHTRIEGHPKEDFGRIIRMMVDEMVQRLYLVEVMTVEGSHLFVPPMADPMIERDEAVTC